MPESTSLPEGYRDGFLASVGDARNISEGEALHVGHAVVQAAVEAARRATNAPFHVVFEAGANASEDVRGLAGLRGRLAVTQASYRGIERVDNLLITAVLDAADEPLETAVVDGLLALPVREGGPASEFPDARAIDDAIDAAVFSDQAAVSAKDEARFEQMLRQLDHYLADQVLIMRRREARLNAQIDDLQQRRNRAAGVLAGDAADLRIKQLLKEREQIAQQITRLEEGGDDEYREWRDRLFARRYSKPDILRVLDVRFEIVGAPC